MNRRSFLALGGAAAAALVLDPERVLWVPGARTFFLPSTTIVEAATMAEAISRGFLAVFRDGVQMEIRISGSGAVLDGQLAREVADVRRMGGRIVRNLQWEKVTLADH